MTISSQFPDLIHKNHSNLLIKRMLAILPQDKLLRRLAQHNAFWEADLFYIFHPVCCNHQTCNSYACVLPQRLDTPSLHSLPLHTYKHMHTQTADKCTLTSGFIQLWWLCSFICDFTGLAVSFNSFVFTCSEGLWVWSWPAALFGRQKWGPACNPPPPGRVYLFWRYSVFFDCRDP